MHLANYLIFFSAWAPNFFFAHFFIHLNKHYLTISFFKNMESITHHIEHTLVMLYPDQFSSYIRFRTSVIILPSLFFSSTTPHTPSLNCNMPWWRRDFRRFSDDFRYFSWFFTAIFCRFSVANRRKYEHRVSRRARRATRRVRTTPRRHAHHHTVGYSIFDLPSRSHSWPLGRIIGVSLARLLHLLV